MSADATTRDPDTHDVDHLLAGYRAARAQEALFDLRGGAGTGYDEFVDAAGNIRAAWLELAEVVGERGRSGLDRLRAVVRENALRDFGALRTGEFHLIESKLKPSGAEYTTLHSFPFAAGA